MLNIPYQFGFNFGRQPIEFPVRSWFLECLENSEIPEAEILHFKSIIEAISVSVNSFRYRNQLNLTHVCTKIQDLLDAFDGSSSIKLLLCKFLVQIVCKNVQLWGNGETLNLQPVCTLLRDWIDNAATIDSKKLLLKTAVDALEAVIGGNQSNLLSASEEIQNWIEIFEFADNDLNMSTSDYTLFKFIGKTFCTSSTVSSPNL